MEVCVRIWDVAAGYLNRQSLLAEHREIHGLHSILVNGKKGYSHHPETVRWVGCLSGLALRHALLVAEMRLRGFSHHTPIPEELHGVQWPTVFVTTVADQYELLKTKYVGKASGRIPLPRNAQELWGGHKYSLMARDLTAYRAIGRRVARMRHGADFSDLAEELVTILRQEPRRGGLVNTIEHMWGHVSHAASDDDRAVAAKGSTIDLLARTHELAVRIGEEYILRSTALSELAVFVQAV
jgi:hypothetical protein